MLQVTGFGQCELSQPFLGQRLAKEGKKSGHHERCEHPRTVTLFTIKYSLPYLYKVQYGLFFLFIPVIHVFIQFE